MIANADPQERQLAYRSDALQQAIAASSLTASEKLAVSSALTEGSLTWAMPISGEDGSDFFEFIATNDGQGPPPAMNEMNCYEFVLYSAWRLGQLDTPRIVTLYDNGVLGAPKYEDLGYDAGLPALDPNAGTGPAAGDFAYILPGRHRPMARRVLARRRRRAEPVEIPGSKHPRGEGQALGLRRGWRHRSLRPARMAVIWLWALWAAGCAQPVAPIVPVPAAEAPLDAATVDLDVVAGQVATLSPLECQILALRAHDAALALEAAPTDANRPARWRLHALAATLAEPAGIMRAPFYGEIEGLIVSLHDLRNAQLLREDATLGSGGSSPVTEARLRYAQGYLDMPGDPASVDAERVLALLRAPFVR